jgi:glyoxylate reductase
VRILIPQPIAPSAVERLRRLGEVTLFPHLDRRMGRAELLQAVRDQHVLYALGRIAYDREVITAAGELRLIAAMNVAATYVDVAAATQRGVPVSCIPNVMGPTTGEFTFALLMATAWRIPEADRFLRAGRWRQNQSMALLGTRVSGKTLGLVGLGAIGREVAVRAAAFGMTVRYSKRIPLSADAEQELGVRHQPLDELFAESDFLVVAVPLTRETWGLVNSRLINCMKRTAILINTGRGAVVDEGALEAALREGRIAGAGLDVYERERPDHEDAGPRPGLLELDNVVLTPHIGSAARETREEMAHRTVDSIEAFLAGGRPPCVLNPEVYGEAPRPEERIG